MNLNDYLKSEELRLVALTHRSYCNEHPGVTSNERLEFLGDSALSLVISDRLFKLLPHSPEGELTGRRPNLVQTSTLAEKAKFLNLDKLLLLSKGEEDSGGRSNTGLLANTFEAVLGAIFIDSGLGTCYQFLDQVFPNDEILSEKINSKDPKSLLQEFSQAQGWGTPTYQIDSTSGPDHAKTFTVSVYIDTQRKGTGQGPSKQKAESQAAVSALSELSPKGSS